MGVRDACWDWVGFDRGLQGTQAGFILCLTCGQRWVVPKCWLNKPSSACIAVLERHRQECDSTSKGGS